jgi:hypothetical protein
MMKLILRTIINGIHQSGLTNKQASCLLNGWIHAIHRQAIEYSLNQNYPNPFNPSTTIIFTISDLRFTTLKDYDVLGNEIATLVNEEKPAGIYEVVFNAFEYPSGIYFYRLQAGKLIQTKKMILLK